MSVHLVLNGRYKEKNGANIYKFVRELYPKWQFVIEDKSTEFAAIFDGLRF